MKNILKILFIVTIALMMSACATEPLKAPSFCDTKTKINHW